MAVTAGTWVEIEQTLLSARDRVASVPEDTASVPLLMRVRGFLVDDADPGDGVTVRTLAGRHLKGRLVEPAPRHTHDFGRPDPVILGIGPFVRERLRGDR